MLRLFLDDDHGAYMIPCPVCGRPLLLGVERRGRSWVGYRDGFYIRPGKQALLVCPGYECSHKEEVMIAHTADDAVVFSPTGAAGLYQMEERAYDRTLDEMKAEMNRLRAIHRQTGNPKLSSAMNFWHRRYRMQYALIKGYLERSFRERSEVVCEGNELVERGRVKAVLYDGVLFERSGSSETLFLKATDLKRVSLCLKTDRPVRFDFGDQEVGSTGCHPVYTPNRYVIIGPWRLALDAVTDYGLCRVHTDSPEAARALGLWGPTGSLYRGEFPVALVDRAFLVVRHCWVGSHRLHVQSFTSDPAVLQLATREMAVARALKMTRDSFWYLGERRALHWWRYFRRTEITALEEREVPIHLTWRAVRGRNPVRRVHKPAQQERFPDQPPT